MIKALLLTVAIMNVLHVTGQSEYQAWLIDTDTLLPKPIRLISTGDSSISIILVENGRMDPLAPAVQPVQFPVSGIRTLQFRHKHSMLKALAVSVPLGFLIGAGASRNTFNPASFAIPLGACMTVGLAIGSTRRNMHIDGRLSRYNRLRKSLEGYVEQ